MDGAWFNRTVLGTGLIMSDNRWLLPEGIEEVLPEAAKRLEDIRRQLVDLYFSWGYELVMPPFIEYLESLLTSSGSDLDLQTFKITDQLTGRAMGVRADMTPQVARIDSVALHRQQATRLCYMGTVLRTHPVELGGSRSPLQIGAELYGHQGPESDVEIISLMMQSLKRVGVEDVLLDLGHVGIFRGLSRRAGFDEIKEAELFDILQRKSVPELDAFLQQSTVDDTLKSQLASLCAYNGGIEVLDSAMHDLQGSGDEVVSALNTLRSVADSLLERIPGLKLHIDLAELRGYNYHTGVVFAAYSIGHGKAIAQGGRYDNIGQDFGVSRPATGFSADLKQWVRLSGQHKAAYVPGILAPCGYDSDLQQTIDALRQSGERVIQQLPGDEKGQGCDRRLVRKNNQWEVIPTGE